MKPVCIALFIFILITGCTSTPKKVEEQTVPAVFNTDKETQETEAVTQMEEVEPEIIDIETELEEKEKSDEIAVKEVSLIAKETSYYSDGMLDEYTVYFYKKNSPEIMKEEIYNNIDKIIESYVYEYQNGNLVKKIMLNSDGNCMSSRVYEYNDRNLLESESRYDENETVQSVSKYMYDSDNNKVQWDLYDGDGILLAHNIYLYKKNTNTGVEFYNPSGKLQKYSVIEYDVTLNRIKESFYLPNGKLDNYTKYMYEEGRMVSEESHKAQGALTKSIEYKYDGKGSVIKIYYYNKKQMLTEIKERSYIYLSNV